MIENTKKQLDANKKNAKLGGVKTNEGKKISSQNAIKHGLLSKQAILKNENAEEFNKLEKGMHDQFKPEGMLEKMLVDKLVVGFWRIKRLITVECKIFEIYQDFQGEEEKNIGKAFIFDKEYDNTFEKLSRYEVSIERSIIKIIHLLKDIRDKNDSSFS